jgi:hypothetical protein
MKDLDGKLVARFCNPVQNLIETIELPAKYRQSYKVNENKNLKRWIIAWPPEDQFRDRMRQKVLNLAKHPELRKRSSPFNGSIKSGIDFRHTIRSYWSRTPKLYVKDYLPQIKKDISDREPIVWIFNKIPKNDEPYYFRCNWIGVNNDESLQYIANWKYRTEPYPIRANEQAAIYHCNMLGYVSFCDVSLTFERLKSKLGGDINEYVPKIEGNDTECSGNRILLDQMRRSQRGGSWWECLLLSAIEFAKRNVICVLPEQFVIPEFILSKASEKGKIFQLISLSRFTQVEQRELRNCYILDVRIPEIPADTNDPSFCAYIINKYKVYMEEFWEDFDYNYVH